MLICAIADVIHANPSQSIVSQSPKFKLADSLGIPNYTDSDSNKYNQNKNKAKAICQHFLDASF
jgi:hypothetical protein